MSFTVPLLIKLLSVLPAVGWLCFNGLVLQPYLLIALFIPLLGGGIVNIFSRYRTPEIVCAEYFLQVPWACWLLGGGCCGITFALCLFACGLYTDTEMKAFNRSPVTSHRTVRKKKRPVAAVDDRFHSQRKCILAFAVAVHIWLLQSVAASVHMPVWPASQWLKLGVSCYVVFSLWKPANDKLVGSWSLRPSLPWRK